MDQLNGDAGGGREQRVSEAFVALADTLVDDRDGIELLDRLIGYSVALLAADEAGLMLTDAGRKLRVVASTSKDAELVQALQLQAGEGPGPDCFRSREPVAAPDLAQRSGRWPRFVGAFDRIGTFRSMHTLPLGRPGQAIGVLSLLRRTPGTFSVADLALGQALADVATIGILRTRRSRRTDALNGQLQAALSSRVIIEQAKGVLTQRTGLTMEVAFDRMRRHARGSNQRLAEVARQVVVGELDLDPLPNPPRAASRNATPGGSQRASH